MYKSHRERAIDSTIGFRGGDRPLWLLVLGRTCLTVNAISGGLRSYKHFGGWPSLRVPSYLSSSRPLSNHLISSPLLSSLVLSSPLPSSPLAHRRPHPGQWNHQKQQQSYHPNLTLQLRWGPTSLELQVAAPCFWGQGFRHDVVGDLSCRILLCYYYYYYYYY